MKCFKCNNERNISEFYKEQNQKEASKMSRFKNDKDINILDYRLIQIHRTNVNTLFDTGAENCTFVWGY